MRTSVQGTLLPFDRDLMHSCSAVLVLPRRCGMAYCMDLLLVLEHPVGSLDTACVHWIPPRWRDLSYCVYGSSECRGQFDHFIVL
jgi:hypothetical protein